MGLESGTFIEDLVPSNPLGTDSKAQGDNHIRLIKNVLQNQFPNLGSEAVDATAAQLNAVQTSLVPEGGIIMFSGTTAQVPSGWQLCNGTGTTNNLSIPVPNLENRFVVGSITDIGGTYDIGETGGSADLTGSTEGHAVTIDEMPAHVHGGGTLIGTFQDTSGGVEEQEGPKAFTKESMDSVGGGDPHTHDINITNGSIPPYYALAYIIFLG